MWSCLASDLTAELAPSQRFQSSVYRRYNDFVVFHALLLQKFPYRMVPALPPKRMLGGTAGLVGAGPTPACQGPGSVMAATLLLAISGFLQPSAPQEGRQQSQPLGCPGSSCA